MRTVVTKVITVVAEAGTLVLRVAGLALDAISWVFDSNNWKLLVAAFDGSMAAVVSWFKDNVDADYISSMRAKFQKASAKQKAEMIRNKSYQVLRLGE